jgi:hypothetical protein
MNERDERPRTGSSCATPTSASPIGGLAENLVRSNPAAR